MIKNEAQIERVVMRRIEMRELIDWYCGHHTNAVNNQFLQYLEQQSVFAKINRLNDTRQQTERLR